MILDTMDFDNYEEEADYFHSNLSIKEQITAIRENDAFNKFFNELIIPKSPVAALLLRHPDDLFLNLDPDNLVIPPEFSFTIPILYWENYKEIVSEKPNRPSVVDYFKKETTSEEIEDTEEFEEKSFIEENKLDELLYLLGLKLVQNNPHLLELAQKNEEITLIDVRKAIGQKGIDYTPIKDEFLPVIENIEGKQEIKEISNLILKRSEVETDTTYEIKKVANIFIKSLIDDLVISFSSYAGKFHRGILSTILEHGAPFFRKHNEFTQWSYGFSNQDYQRSLELLWDLELLSPMVINLICQKCKDKEGKPIHQILISDKPPKDLTDKILCGWCSNPLNIQSFYSLDYRLIRLINTNDKLLFYTIAFLLDKYNLDWESNIHSDVSEHDFHVKVHDELRLIECKVFRISGSTEDDINYHTKVQEGISQLIKHMSEVNADSAIFVCYPCRINKEDLDKWIDTAMKKSEVSINKDKINVIGPDNLSSTLKELK
ncbi:MAG: hypothetical protein ACW99A_15930 [Candidatus Kariarchaeaceae archaeon]|jgi:hypothetical protein